MNQKLAIFKELEFLIQKSVSKYFQKIPKKQTSNHTQALKFFLFVNQNMQHS